MEQGTMIPALPIQGTSGLTGQLSDYSKTWLILYFYPKDATSGCTREGQAFRDCFEAFKALNAQIFGVSRDTLSSHERFKEKQQFPFELLSDTDETLCQAFDVIKDKKMYGKAVRGIERSTFLIAPGGEVVKVWRKVKVDGHVEAVLEALKEAHASLHQ